MRNLEKKSIQFLRFSIVMLLVPAAVAGVTITLISLVTVIFYSDIDWEFIGVLYWAIYIISFLLFYTFMFLMEDED